jgi:hypothetical protein
MKLSRDKVLTIVLFMVALVAFFVTSLDYECAFDDMKYQFVFSDASECGDVANMEMAHTWKDVMRSQYWHYFYANGRIPVHILVQLFICVFPHIVYAIANTLCFLIAVILIAKYVTRSASKWLYLFVVLSMMYLFPSIMMSSTPWFTADVSLNYLWPATLAVGVLTILSSPKYDDKNRWYNYLGLILLGFFAGWSNEAFAVPLSGAVFFYMIIRKTWFSGAKRAMVFALWLGAVMVVFSPGTLLRASHHMDDGASQLFIMLLESYSDVKFIWLFLIAMLAMVARHRVNIRAFLSENLLCSLVLGVGLVFSIYAHTYSHSLTCIELMSLILLAKLLMPSKPLIKNRRVDATVFVCIVVAFGIHQAYICKANHLLREEYLQMEQRYKESPDGLFKDIDVKFNGVIAPFVYNYAVSLNPIYYVSPEFSIVNGCPGKMPLALTAREYNGVIEHPDSFFVDANLVPGSAHLYNGDNYFFARLEPGEEPQCTLMAHFDNPNFVQNMSLGRRLVYKLLGNKKAPKALDAYVVDTRCGRYLVANKILSVPSSIEIE